MVSARADVPTAMPATISVPTNPSEKDDFMIDTT